MNQLQFNSNKQEVQNQNCISIDHFYLQPRYKYLLSYSFRQFHRSCQVSWVEKHQIFKHFINFTIIFPKVEFIVID